MTIYIALLRGINVSGKNKLSMADLRAMFQEMKFSDIKTYIQSGNVVFTTNEQNILSLQNNIELKIKSTFGLDVPVIIRTANKLQNVYNNNPFLKNGSKDGEKLYLTFLSEVPAKENIEKATAFDFKPEEFIIRDREVFLFVPNGYGNSKLSNTFFENKLKVAATTRNWRTIGELLKMAETKNDDEKEVNNQ